MQKYIITVKLKNEEMSLKIRADTQKQATEIVEKKYQVDEILYVETLNEYNTRLHIEESKVVHYRTYIKSNWCAHRPSKFYKMGS